LSGYLVTAQSEYRPRVVDAELRDRLASSGAVVIEGPKACGKTATARQVAASEVLLDVDANARQAVAVDASLVLDGAAPRLIDEWQVEPAIWNHIRRAVDARGRRGQFILTGSAVPSDDITRHTGAGRLTRLRMRPMSLFESGHSSGAVSLLRMLEGKRLRSTDSKLSIAEVASVVAVGGWPGHLGLSAARSLQAVRDYLEEIRRVDVGRVDGRRRDPENVARLLRALARHAATPVSAATLAADAGGADGALDAETVRDYLSALTRLMIVEDAPAWAPRLRSRSILRRAPVRHFADPSLAVAALRASPERLLGELNVLGQCFESLVVRDLRVYAQAADARVLHYRDNTGLEVDAIVETADGRWAAFEVKLGSGHVETAAKNLRRFVERVDTSKSGAPQALAVVTATGYAFVRDDGVSVIPIGALGP
jgi:predicted AAA+ superfamily ATPase